MENCIIISGFLGSGKTTLIRKIIENISNKKIIVIENDFGEINTDSLILNNYDISVREINAGCICCNINGDFKTALKEILTKQNPDICIIEPSGIAKTSEIKNTIIVENINPTIICTVDINTIKKYFDNFGKIFDDQIIHSDYLYLTKKDDNRKYEEEINIIKNLKPELNLIDETNIINLILTKYDTTNNYCNCTHSHTHCNCNNEHSHKCNHEHNDNHHCNCGHNHKNDNISGDFSTVNILIKSEQSLDNIKKFIEKVICEHNIIRIKGFYNKENYIEFDGNTIKTSNLKANKTYLTMIGKNLNENKLNALWRNYEK